MYKDESQHFGGFVRQLVIRQRTLQFCVENSKLELSIDAKAIQWNIFIVNVIVCIFVVCVAEKLSFTFFVWNIS